MDDVITLSSDDESENPSKRLKLALTAGHRDKVDKQALKRANCLDEISVIKKTSNVTTVNQNGSETIIVDPNEDAGNCNNLKNSTKKEIENPNTTIEILDIQDSPEKRSKIVDANSVNRGDNDDDEKEEEILDYFNLNAEKSNKSNNNDNIIESKGTCDDSKLDNGTTNGDIDDNQPSTPGQSILDQFLEICTNSIKKSVYESRLSDKYKKIRNTYLKCDNIDKDEEFLRIIDNSKDNAKKSPADAVIAFREVYGYIHDYVKSILIEIPSEHVEKVNSLEKCMKVLLKKLKYLEHQEVDFTKDDEDSNYIKFERYSTHLNKVYKKYCQLTNTDPYNGRLLYQKINLTASKHNEINKAVMKSYKRNKFPSYCDVETTVRKCIEKHKIQLTESEVVDESKKCFKKLGEILQSRRKQELRDNLLVYEGEHDPASDDTELDQRLRENLGEGEKKIQDIIDKYAKMQETNQKEKDVEDSNDSNSEEEEDEDDDDDDDGDNDEDKATGDEKE